MEEGSLRDADEVVQLVTLSDGFRAVALGLQLPSHVSMMCSEYH